MIGKLRERIVGSGDKTFLYQQLIGLGDMMGDGLHHESDGKWIQKNINDLMLERINIIKCQRCQGNLKQLRSGSMRAKCEDCGARFQLLKKHKGRAG